jgi:hypothetical protein
MSDQLAERVYGCIDKKEFITNSDSDTMPGIFALKIWKPFPGLYIDPRIKNVPEFFFMVLEKEYPPELIISASEEINRDCEFDFNAVAGEISLPGATYPVIRLKNLRNQECIKELRSRYNEKGIYFNKKPEHVEAEGMVKIIKYFTIEKVGEGIYFDTAVPELGYIDVPYRPEWDLFEAMTRRIKVNVALGTFDAALGLFYRDKEEYNVFRIFNVRRSASNLAMIKKQYDAVMCNPEVLDAGRA